MNTKVFALIAIAALTLTLITATMTRTNAFASHVIIIMGSREQLESAQSNSCVGFKMF